MASERSEYVRGFDNGWKACVEWLAENYPALTDEGDGDYPAILDAAAEHGHEATGWLEANGV